MVTDRERLLEQSGCETLLFADGFDKAIIGVSDDKVVYSIPICIEILAETMTDEEASEYFYFNVKGSYVGEQTPIFVDTYEYHEEI